MAAAAGGYPDATVFLTPARLRMVAITRRLVDAVLDATSREDELTAAGDDLERVVQDMEGRIDPASVPRSLDRRHGDYLPRSPLVGELNAVAPPFDYEYRDNRLHAHGSFGAAHEGPPGYVHGGWIALAFDEALGIANVAGNTPGMTARLTVRYRRPTPLRKELVLQAWTEQVEGRRIRTVGMIVDGDTVTAEAEGIFVNIGGERALEYFGEQPSTREPTDPLP